MQTNTAVKICCTDVQNAMLHEDMGSFPCSINSTCNQPFGTLIGQKYCCTMVSKTNSTIICHQRHLPNTARVSWIWFTNILQSHICWCLQITWRQISAIRVEPVAKYFEHWLIFSLATRVEIIISYESCLTKTLGGHYRYTWQSAAILEAISNLAANTQTNSDHITTRNQPHYKIGNRKLIQTF